MSTHQDYLDTNRELWNNKIAHHLASEFYNMEGFLKGESSLNTIELPLLGDVRGKSILHLQCHFGQDSLSLARMGAKVTGTDLSNKAIEQAKLLNLQLGLDADFVVSDTYALPSNLPASFDTVFTSYGVLGWLPDMPQWARVVKHFLKPGGKLVLVEFHPVVWMLDEHLEKISYRYFNDEAIIELQEGTYAQQDAPIANKSISWNHSLGEVMGSLIEAGLQITHFQEYDFSPYNCFSGMKEDGDRVFRHVKLDNKLPMVYSLVATRGDL